MLPFGSIEGIVVQIKESTVTIEIKGLRTDVPKTIFKYSDIKVSQSIIYQIRDIDGTHTHEIFLNLSDKLSDDSIDELFNTR